MEKINFSSFCSKRLLSFILAGNILLSSGSGLIAHAENESEQETQRITVEDGICDKENSINEFTYRYCVDGEYDKLSFEETVDITYDYYINVLKLNISYNSVRDFVMAHRISDLEITNPSLVNEIVGNRTDQELADSINDVYTALARYEYDNMYEKDASGKYVNQYVNDYYQNPVGLFCPIPSLIVGRYIPPHTRACLKNKTCTNAKNYVN